MLQPEEGIEMGMEGKTSRAADCLSQLASSACAIGIFGEGRVGRGQQQLHVSAQRLLSANARHCCLGTNIFFFRRLLTRSREVQIISHPKTTT